MKKDKLVHFVLTSDGKKKKLYLNGDEVKTKNPFSIVFWVKSSALKKFYEETKHGK